VAEALRTNIVEEPLSGQVDLNDLTISPWSTLTLLLKIE
jgi:hypothetical protein